MVEIVGPSLRKRSRNLWLKFLTHARPVGGRARASRGLEALRRAADAPRRWPVVTRGRLRRLRPVCTENLILFDYVTESPYVNGDDRAALLLLDPVRLAVQVEEPT
jgi:hypothetical protein